MGFKASGKICSSVCVDGGQSGRFPGKGVKKTRALRSVHESPQYTPESGASADCKASTVDFNHFFA